MLHKIICEFVCIIFSGKIAFTLAIVPTGIKVGVSIIPFDVVIFPSLAFPNSLIFLKLNFLAIIIFFVFKLLYF